MSETDWWHSREAGIKSATVMGPPSYIDRNPMGRTSTERPVLVLVTRTIVPNGNERWAAVNAYIEKRSPLAV